jgi:hypothetical protein
MTLSFFGVGTGYTPTASEVYGIRTARIAPVAPLLLYSPVARAGVGGAADVRGADLHRDRPHRRLAGVGEQAQRASGPWRHRRARLGDGHAGGQLLQLHRPAIVPTTETYTIGNFQVKSPGAGNVVYQSVVPPSAPPARSPTRSARRLVTSACSPACNKRRGSSAHPASNARGLSWRVLSQQSPTKETAMERKVPDRAVQGWRGERGEERRRRGGARAEGFTEPYKFQEYPKHLYKDGKCARRTR